MGTLRLKSLTFKVEAKDFAQIGFVVDDKYSHQF